MDFDDFYIRLLQMDDAVSYFQLIDSNRPRLEDYFAGTVSKTQTLEATKNHLVDVMHRLQNKEYLPFVIVDKNTNGIVGFIDVKRIEWKIPKGELGCYFDSSYVGRGLSKKAMKLVIKHLFAHYKFKKLNLRTHESNIAARALAISCGFILEGHVRRDFCTTKGDVIDLMHYGLISIE